MAAYHNINIYVVTCCKVAVGLWSRFLARALISKIKSLALMLSLKKVKNFPYSLPSVGPRADPDIQAVSPQVTISDPCTQR